MRRFTESMRWIIGLALAGFIVFGQLNTAWALVPPASTLSVLLRRPCALEMVNFAFDRQNYAIGDTAVLTVQIKRAKGAKGHIRVTIPQPELFGQATIDPSTFVAGRQAGQPELTLRTYQQVALNQTITIKLFYKAEKAGSATINGTAVSLNASDQPMTNCQVQGSESVTVAETVPPTQLDIAPEATIRPEVIGELQTLTLNAKIKNVGSEAIPADMAMRLTVTYPNLDYMGSVPQSESHQNGRKWETVTREPLPTNTYHYYYDASGNRKDWNYQISLKTRIPVAKFYEPEVCVTMLNVPSTYSENQGNNCVKVRADGAAIRVTKTWADTQTAEIRDVSPGSILNFNVKVKNVSGEAVSGVLVDDMLATTIDCNPLSNPAPTNPCPAWDETVVWHSIDPKFQQAALDRLELKPEHRPVSLSAGQELSYSFAVKVLDSEALLQKMLPDRSQPRCNVARARVADTKINLNAPLCWTYKVPADVKVTNAFKVGNATAQSVTLKQGDVATYQIVTENLGPNKAIGLDFEAQQTERTHGAGGRHLTQWVRSSIIDPATEVDDLNHTLSGWSVKSLDQGQKHVIEPKFIVPCDALEGMTSAQRQNAKIDAVATVLVGNDSNTSNNTSNVITANLAGGHYNLGGQASAQPNPVTPGDPTKNTTTVTATLTNNDDGKVDMAVPLVTLKASIPAQFKVVAISDGGRLDEDGNVVWDPIERVELNSTNQKRWIKLEVEPNALRTSVPARVQFTAISASANEDRTCGYTTFSGSINILGADPIPEKMIIDSNGNATDVHQIQRGEQATFQLRVRNDSATTDITRPEGNELVITDNLDPDFRFTSNNDVTCELIINGTSQACTEPNQQLKPTTSDGGQVLSWKVRNLPKQSILQYRFKIAVSQNITFTACPMPMYNGSPSTATVLTDAVDETEREFNLVTLRVQPDKCLEGNIYARNTASEFGIKIDSQEVIVDPGSILSAKGSIQCHPNNESCQRAPWKIQNYNTDQSIGLNFEKVVKRMHRNIQRIKSQARPLNQTVLDTTFDLYGGESSTKYPNGRVWERNGDLTIDTKANGMVFKGKGTIIVRGNLIITGDSKLTYDKLNSPSTAVGFIVLPHPSNPSNTGRIIVHSGVTELRGAYYAPGTDSANVVLNPNGAAGSFTFEGNEGGAHLNPARGLFIAREFDVRRKKFALSYDPLLSKSEAAPPGFTFASSPGETLEGS